MLRSRCQAIAAVGPLSSAPGKQAGKVRVIERTQTGASLECGQIRHRNCQKISAHLRRVQFLEAVEDGLNALEFITVDCRGGYQSLPCRRAAGEQHWNANVAADFELEAMLPSASEIRGMETAFDD